MTTLSKTLFLLLLTMLLCLDHLTAQNLPVADSIQYKKVVADRHHKYDKGAIHRFFWGSHYRKEWETPVSFKVAMLDTLAGGLTPYEKGGGRQSRSLRLRDANKREYVLRSIDKSFGKALPGITHGTFIERIADDQVTIGHPFSALTISPMAEAAKIYHTIPKIYYIPKQLSLGEFNEDFGDELYLFEQRPDENWETAPNFGNAKNIIGTDKLFEKLREDNDNTVDQLAYVRARLFDILIGDWGRHEDQWRWAAFKNDKQTLYKPVPRDRDQAYTKFDGFLVRILIQAAGAKHLQTFDHKIKNIKRFNFPARNLDLRLTNEVSLDQWINIAKDLQQSLTNDIIDSAIKCLPAEVYPISGPGIAAKLKSRRDILVKETEKYFRFLNRQVDIPGSEGSEFFEVKRLNDDSTEVNIYKINKEGNVKEKPFYHRIFINRQTKEIRVYGLKGQDKFKVTGTVKRGIKVRLIGGPDKDSLIDESRVREIEHQTKIYDNSKNDIKTSKETALRLSSDPSIHAYYYKAFKYERESMLPVIFYNSDDRIHVGIVYSRTKQQWRKDPFGFKQYLDLKYSVEQKGFSSTYKSTYTELAGKWNLDIYANYDEIRWTNFYGLGNETALSTTDRDFFRVRSRQVAGVVGVERFIRNRHRITIHPFYQSIDIINDTARFLSKQFIPSPGIYGNQLFAGADVSYIYQNLNDSSLPVKGISFRVHGNYTNNLKNSNDFSRYGAELNLYLPFTQKIGIAIKSGAASLTGKPEFYQYNRIGGSETLRGHQRDRFYGNSSFYNQNELRWISNFRSFLFNGKIGVFGLYDIGRVWLKNEHSDVWHTGYGGGLILSPFNRLSITAAYAKSVEDWNIHVNIMKIF